MAQKVDTNFNNFNKIIKSLTWNCKNHKRRIYLSDIFSVFHFIYNYDVSKNNSLIKYYRKKCAFSVSKIILVLIIFISILDIGYAYKIGYDENGKQHFTKQKKFQPKLFHGKHKRSIIGSTLEEEGLHATHLTLTYEHLGEEVVIDLQLNTHLLPKGHFLSYQIPNGKKIIKNFTKNDVDLCHYQGQIRDKIDSRVAVSTCYGISGVVFDGKNTYYIKPNSDGKLHSEHYIIDHVDMTHNVTCGYEGGINKSHDPDLIMDSEFNRILRYKRSSSDTTIRGPYNSNMESSYVEFVLVVDNKVYKSMGDSLKRVHNHCKEIANIINSLYVPLNIFIALVGVVVWTENNEVELSSDGDKTLKNFLHYRRKTLVKEHPNDNAQLLTKEQFDGGVVGKALKGPICTYEFSGGVSMDHSPITSVVATTVAHEMGHNFGMEHDNSDCKCEDDRCIMSSSSTTISPKHWSSCSIDQLNLAFHHGMNYCLKNKPESLFEASCGNDFLEQGEQCDCGLPSVCDNPCCDPNTCMLHLNASCATGECCDLTTCRPHQQGSICRLANGECDLPEYCTGESEYCPTNVFKRDTESCNNEKAFCFHGSCRSHTDQCKILWGLSGKSSDQCYEKNKEGSHVGNCGFDRLTNYYTPCESEDVDCGMLHCRHLNERLEFGMESVAVLAHSFINYRGQIIPCRTAVVDLGLNSIDPGLTPDGAKCGEGKMCVKQKCMLIDNLRKSGVGIACPDNCNGNGICNSKGHCHCNTGYAPPTCKYPGAGGSEDSGPAANLEENAGFVRILYIFFLGVVPTMSIIALVVFYWLQKQRERKPPITPKSTNNQNQTRNAPSSPGQPASTPSSPDDMNALLKTENDAIRINNHMFGKFKGFTLKPLAKETGPNLVASNVAYVHPVTKVIDENSDATILTNRLAPPIPKPPKISRSQTTQQAKPSKVTVHRSNTGIKSSSNTPQVPKNIESAPALPPLNPGSNPRPIISSPILEASTCTAKELISPLRTNANKYPIRSAPSVPSEVHNNIQATTLNVFIDKDNKEKEKKPKEGTLQRIASFLKKEDKTDYSTLQKSAANKKPIVIDKDKLRNIEISSPIQHEEDIYIPDTSEYVGDRTSVTRSHSMRDPTVEKRTNIQTFGSMRTNLKRPNSIVGNRPKSPPPPRPPAPATTIITGLKIPGLPGYSNPPLHKKNQLNEYDDCEATEKPLKHISEENSPTDNIYSVIDETETPFTKKNNSSSLTIPPDTKANNKLENMSLLGEIVNEIENRNFDSIYSASTLKRKKSNDKNELPYANTSQDDCESEYSTMNVKSNASTTSSGYLRPSAINTTPIARIAPTKPETSKTPSNSLSSFKSTTKSSENEKKTPTYEFKNNKKIIPEVHKDNKDTELSTGYNKPFLINSNRSGPTTSLKTEEKPQKITNSTPKTNTVNNKTVKPTNVTPKLQLNTTNISKKNTDDVISLPTSQSKLKQSDVITNNSIKPKTFQKPNTKFNRQNSGDKIIKPKSLINQKNVDNAKLQDTANSNNVSNTIIKPNNISNNKTRPGKGKAISMLQQKFENGNTKN